MDLISNTELIFNVSVWSFVTSCFLWKKKCKQLHVGTLNLYTGSTETLNTTVPGSKLGNVEIASSCVQAAADAPEEQRLE